MLLTHMLHSHFAALPAPDDGALLFHCFHSTMEVFMSSIWLQQPQQLLGPLSVGFPLQGLTW